MSDVPTYAYVMVSAILFAIGLLAIVLHAHAIRLLMGIELILNGANINFIVFGAQFTDPSGMVFVLFTIAIAAAEAAVGLAIFINLFRVRDSVDVRSVTTMRW